MTTAPPIHWEDIRVFNSQLAEDEAEAMIRVVWSRALKIAPCLKEDDLPDDDMEYAKSIIIGIVLRWAEQGAGGRLSRTAGDYSESFSQGGLLRPDDISALQKVCEGFRNSRAFSFSTAPGYVRVMVRHSPECSIHFGGLLCSCGAELSGDGRPLW